MRPHLLLVHAAIAACGPTVSGTGEDAGDSSTGTVMSSSSTGTPATTETSTTAADDTSGSAGDTEAADFCPAPFDERNAWHGRGVFGSPDVVGDLEYACVAGTFGVTPDDPDRVLIRFSCPSARLPSSVSLPAGMPIPVAEGEEVVVSVTTELVVFEVIPHIAVRDLEGTLRMALYRGPNPAGPAGHDPPFEPLRLSLTEPLCELCDGDDDCIFERAAVDVTDPTGTTRVYGGTVHQLEIPAPYAVHVSEAIIGCEGFDCYGAYTRIALVAGWLQ